MGNLFCHPQHCRPLLLESVQPSAALMVGVETVCSAMLPVPMDWLFYVCVTERWKIGRERGMYGQTRKVSDPLPLLRLWWNSFHQVHERDHIQASIGRSCAKVDKQYWRTHIFIQDL